MINVALQTLDEGVLQELAQAFKERYELFFRKGHEEKVRFGLGMTTVINE